MVYQNKEKGCGAAQSCLTPGEATKEGAEPGVDKIITMPSP